MLVCLSNGGAPREILQGVSWADWSPDGKELAVVHPLEGTARVEFPIGKVLYETKGDLGHVRVSPRGDWLAFIDHPHNVEGGSLVAVDRSGAKRTLSEGWSDLYGVAWRPDGREVWFTASRKNQRDSKALYAVTLDGKERLVARTLGDVDLEDIGRDGRVLLSQLNWRIEVEALPRGASEERELTWLGASFLLDISEDGDRVLFAAPDGQEGGAARPIGPEGILRPLVSPDGRTLVARLHDQRVLLPVDGGPPRACPGIEREDRLLRWSADGRSVFIRRDKPRAIEVYRLDVASGRRTLLWELAPRDRAGVTFYHLNFQVRVTPDGKSYAYSYLRSLSQLYLVEGLK